MTHDGYTYRLTRITPRHSYYRCVTCKCSVRLAVDNVTEEVAMGDNETVHSGHDLTPEVAKEFKRRVYEKADGDPATLASVIIRGVEESMAEELAEVDKNELPNYNNLARVILRRRTRGRKEETPMDVAGANRKTV